MTDEKWGVGNRADSKPYATVKVGEETVELIHGQFPHSRSDDSTYARFQNGEIEPFSGHRILHRVEFQDYNYLKQSGLSGDDVRKGGTCKVWMNETLVCEFFYRDIFVAMEEVQYKIRRLSEFPIQLWDADEVAKLPGRKIYYREFPAKIKRYVDSRACLVIVPDHPEGKLFPLSPYEIEDGETDSEDSEEVLVEIDSPHIWWWRER